VFIEYHGLSEINGNVIVLDGVESPVYNEIVEISVDGNMPLCGRVIKIDGDKVVVLVFGSTRDFSLTNTRIRLTGQPMHLLLSDEILGRIFDGTGCPIDGMGQMHKGVKRQINGKAINPVLRSYPRSCIQTGISAVDGMVTLIQGQKLPIFTGDGLPHDVLAAQIARQAKIYGAGKCDFVIVFAAMGIKHDTYEFFRRAFEESGAKYCMYVNMASDPAIERILTPRCALTAAEYLAFERDMHVLVIMTDMTAYAEALREVSSSLGEIPSRKGYPGYLYSDLASIYERAGLIKGCKGSLTQIPILTMPSDDITHPVADLTGYITEGQIVLDRNLHKRGIYPPINILPSLSRLMKDGIGENRTRPNHPWLANNLFAKYAMVGDARALASIVGMDELPDEDKRVLRFGSQFELNFISQGIHENRSMDKTLDIGERIFLDSFP